MQQTSESIGKIAAALAAAQLQLKNPEKTESATVQTSPEHARSFRYATLAAGLDIIRKTLGEHEIAVVQSTSFDKELGLIRLNTVLAHSSGEWIASDWPVCATAEITSPHRLGAALTYARRYTLFTIVGIAGNDDLDAPDLGNQSAPPRASKRPGGPQTDVSPERSSMVRDKLLAELATLKSLDDLTVWTLRRLSLKRQLLQGDAEQIEAAYLAKMNDAGHLQGDHSLPRSGDAQNVQPIQKAQRRRNKDHLGFVAAQPCMICKRVPCDAHHLKFAQPRALGRKVSDGYTVPLCREHHTELHRHGNEKAWWANAGFAPLDVAAELWHISQRRGADLGNSIHKQTVAAVK